MSDPYTEAQKRLDEKFDAAWQAVKDAGLMDEVAYLVRLGLMPEKK